MLLIGDSSLMSIMCVSQLAHCVAQLTQISRCNNSFTIDQINALTTFTLNTRPGTIRIFRALELMVKSLMFGWVTDDLRQAILDDELLYFVTPFLNGQNAIFEVRHQLDMLYIRRVIVRLWITGR